MVVDKNTYYKQPEAMHFLSKIKNKIVTKD